MLCLLSDDLPMGKPIWLSSAAVVERPELPRSVLALLLLWLPKITTLGEELGAALWPPR